jgi:adenosylmethionine-8-amino-7-oxononanoate aminotransferase
MTVATAFQHGLLTRAPGDTLVLAPPFTCTPGDVDRMVQRLQSAIEDTMKATS